MKLYCHGNGVPRLVLLHGGPGAAGSLRDLAIALSRYGAVMEAFQTTMHIPDLLTELRVQIVENCRVPVVLAGHSWGAWLAALFSAKHPELVEKQILIGSGPLDTVYLPAISRRRTAKMSEQQKMLYFSLLKELEQPDIPDKDEKLKLLGTLPDADYYDKIREEIQDGASVNFNGKQYASIWEQAVQLRSSGSLLSSLSPSGPPIVIIHGTEDPHPWEGVVEPLRDLGTPYRFYMLSKCGHYPWREKHCRHEFLRLIVKEWGPGGTLRGKEITDG